MFIFICLSGWIRIQWCCNIFSSKEKKKIHSRIFFRLLFHKSEIMDRIKYLIENPFCLLLYFLLIFSFDVYANTQK